MKRFGKLSMRAKNNDDEKTNVENVDEQVMLYDQENFNSLICSIPSFRVNSKHRIMRKRPKYSRKICSALWKEFELANSQISESDMPLMEFRESTEKKGGISQVTDLSKMGTAINNYPEYSTRNLNWGRESIADIEEVISGRAVFYQPVIINCREPRQIIRPIKHLRLTLLEAYDLKNNLINDLRDTSIRSLTKKLYPDFNLENSCMEKCIFGLYEDASSRYSCLFYDDNDYMQEHYREEIEIARLEGAGLTTCEWIDRDFIANLSEESREDLLKLIHVKRRAALFRFGCENRNLWIEDSSNKDYVGLEKSIMNGACEKLLHEFEIRICNNVAI